MDGLQERWKQLSQIILRLALMIFSLLVTNMVGLTGGPRHSKLAGRRENKMLFPAASFSISSWQPLT